VDTEKPAQNNDSGCCLTCRDCGGRPAGRYRELAVSVTDLSPAADPQRVTMLSYDMGHQHLPLSRSSQLTDFLLSPLCDLPFLVLSYVEFIRNCLVFAYAETCALIESSIHPFVKSCIQQSTTKRLRLSPLSRRPTSTSLLLHRHSLSHIAQFLHDACITTNGAYDNAPTCQSSKMTWAEAEVLRQQSLQRFRSRQRHPMRT
jgi:hypothetical protein